MNTLDKNKILSISKNIYDDLTKLSNVNGIGIGYKFINSTNTGELSLHVLVEKKVDKSVLGSKNLVPKNYMNVKTDVIEIGKVHSHKLIDRIRPLEGGYSIGPAGYNWAGTLGCIVTRGTTPNIEYFLLSNNHVFSDGGIVPIGNPILQPAVLDRGISSTDKVAILSEVINIDFSGGINKVDCAIAKVTDPSIVTNKIALIGVPKGISQAKLTSMVKKSGRTTSELEGTVQTVNATIGVDYGMDRTAIFSNQFVSTAISSPGDSGSLVLDKDNNAVGLLFAGSSSTTIFTDINSVLSALNVSLLL